MQSGESRASAVGFSCLPPSMDRQFPCQLVMCSVGMLMIPLLLLTGDIDFENDSTAEEFLIEAPDMIPVCVKGICEFWRSHNRKPVVINVTRSRRRGNGVGRR
jgi:hypothetical protein